MRGRKEDERGRRKEEARGKRKRQEDDEEEGKERREGMKEGGRMRRNRTVRRRGGSRGTFAPSPSSLPPAPRSSPPPPPLPPDPSRRDRKITTGIFGSFRSPGAFSGLRGRPKTTRDEKPVPGKVWGPLGANVKNHDVGSLDPPSPLSQRSAAWKRLERPAPGQISASGGRF